MMTISRCLCAIAVLIVASLTPSSCSDVREQAMANEVPPTEVTEEAIQYSLTRGAALDVAPETEEIDS